ncbi:lipoprotein [Mesoplasma photuris]|uniref:lipoprotein n=1 Tax=Mesoplasma photuris TaxID=217731 RepID=UPI0004E14F94|nr:lipoprotein [Mesoplasma photuris]
MKKLIAILGAIALSATTSSLVVSCTKEIVRGDSTSLADDLYNQLIAHANGVGINVGDIYDEQETKDIIMKIMNEEISNSTFLNSKTAMNEILGFDNNDENKLEILKQFDKIKNSIYTTDFFQKYSTSLINKNPLEYLPEYRTLNFLDTKGLLNEVDASVDAKDGVENKMVYVQYQKISTTEEDGSAGSEKSIKDDSDSWTTWLSYDEPFLDGYSETENIPTIEELTSVDNNFRLVTFKTVDATPTNTGPATVLELNGQSLFTASEVLPFRFNNYFKEVLEPQMNDNVLAYSYINKGLYNTYSSRLTIGGRQNFINTNSDLFKSVQSWNDNIENSKSNLKMVWNFSVPTSQFKDLQIKIIDAKKTNPHGFRSLVDVENAFEGFENLSVAGADPFFGDILTSGYNGIVKNVEGGVEVVSGDLLVDDAAKGAINSTNELNILTGDNYEGYASKDGGSKKEYIVVLPIYLVDLFNPASMNINQEIKTGETTTYKMNMNVDEQVLLNEKIIMGEADITNLKFDFEATKAANLAQFDFEQINDGIYVSAKEGATTLSLKNSADETLIDIDVDLTTGINALSMTGTHNEKTYRYAPKFTSDDSLSSQANFWARWTSEANYKQSSDISGLSISKKEELLSQLIYISTKSEGVVEKAKVDLYSEINGDAIRLNQLFSDLEGYLKSDDEESD